MNTNSLPIPPEYMLNKGVRIRDAVMRAIRLDSGRFVVSYVDVGVLISAPDPAVAAFIKKVSDKDKDNINGKPYIMVSAILKKLLDDSTLGFDAIKTQCFEYTVSCLLALPDQRSFV